MAQSSQLIKQMGKFDDVVEDDLPDAPPPHHFPPEASSTKPPRKSNGSGQDHDERPLPEGESAYALLERNIPSPVRMCDPWCTEGVTVLASRPKLGKTTLLRQKLAAAATGGEFFGEKFIGPVRCAFLSLEEGELICREKFKMAGFPEDALAAIQIFFEWPRGDEGVKLLHRYLEANPDVRFIAIDSLTKFRVIPDVRMPAFMADYEAMSQLHEMSKRHQGCAFEVAHHTRKSRSEDPIDDISGTYGLTAACDTYAVMRHAPEGATYHTGGRLWAREDSSYALRRESQRWHLVGVNLGLTQRQAEALDLVRAAGLAGYSGKELSEKLNITVPSAWQRLDELLSHGYVTKRFGRVFMK